MPERADTSWQAIVERSGSREATPEEVAAFEREHGPFLPPDGDSLPGPDTSMTAIRERLGTEPATLAEFEAGYEAVQPADGEG